MITKSAQKAYRQNLKRRAANVKRKEALKTWYEALNQKKPKPAKSLSEWTQKKINSVNAIALGSNWPSLFKIQIERKKTQEDVTETTSIKLIDHHHYQETELKEALNLVYEVSPHNLEQAEYHIWAHASSKTFQTKNDGLNVKIRDAASASEKAAVLYVKVQDPQRSSEEKLSLANNIISLQESFHAYSAYALRALAYEKSMNEILDTKNFVEALKIANLALSAYETFFSKNGMDITVEDKKSWNDFFVAHLDHYQRIQFLKKNIEMEIK